jgi:hypothetical protein
VAARREYQQTEQNEQETISNLPVTGYKSPANAEREICRFLFHFWHSIASTIKPTFPRQGDYCFTLVAAAGGLASNSCFTGSRINTMMVNTP